jgi:regulator of cell morphogenesis and NO signaling
MPHLRKEEELFFPLVKKAEKAIKMGSAPEKYDVETMRKFLPEIVFEHREVETALLSIRELSRGYKIFGVVCSAQGINYEKFKEFEADLQKHVHLENNILLPKIKQMLKAY